MVSYADDFVILSRGKAAQALDWTAAVMGRLGLQLNENKTVIRDGQKGPLTFWAIPLASMTFKKDGSWYHGRESLKDQCKSPEEESRDGTASRRERCVAGCKRPVECVAPGLVHLLLLRHDA